MNVGVQVFYKPRVKRFVPALHEVPAFVRAARTLGALDLPEADAEIRCLRDGARRLSILRRATSWLVFDPGETNDAVASVYKYVNFLFLLEVNAFVFATESLRASRNVMRKMFEAIGYLDAVLSYLNRGDDLVLVATHDIEVIDLLGGGYGAHHFREEIAGGAMTFDYRIRVGPSSTRNAIALLELMQYPGELVADALTALDRQSQLR